MFYRVKKEILPVNNVFSENLSSSKIYLHFNFESKDLAKMCHCKFEMRWSASLQKRANFLTFFRFFYSIAAYRV